MQYGFKWTTKLCLKFKLWWRLNTFPFLHFCQRQRYTTLCWKWPWMYQENWNRGLQLLLKVCAHFFRAFAGAPWTHHSLRGGHVTSGGRAILSFSFFSWHQCRRFLCLEEMDSGNARIWSFRDPISWVCEWRQNRTLNLNFKKVGTEK